ncbi:radical SAM protein, partial [Thermodesulfobacteriota bacterium]
MSDIAFVLCPQWDVVSPPLGQAALVTYLKKAGFSVSIFDFNLDAYCTAPPDQKYLWNISYPGDIWLTKEGLLNNPILSDKSLQSWTGRVVEQKPKIVAFSVYQGNFLSSVKLASLLRIKSPKTIIIMGGPQFTGEESRKLAFCEGKIDGIVIGEGEATLAEIAGCIIERDELKPTASAYLKIDDEIIWGGERPLIKKLDELPFLDYSLFDLERYRWPFRLPILGSRGCISNCVFCSPTTFWRKFRTRSAENIFAEMIYHYRIFGSDTFHFNDSLLNGNLKVLIKLCNLIIDSDLPFSWSGFAMIRTGMSPEIMRKMRRAGCYTLNYGIESCSENVQKLMKKNLKVNTIKEVLKNTKHAGIQTRANFIVGFPGETEKDFQATVDFISDHHELIDRIGGVQPCGTFEGSDLARHPGKYGIQLSDYHSMWSSLNNDNTFEIRKRRQTTLEDKVREVKLNSFDRADEFRGKEEYKKAMRLYMELPQALSETSYVLYEIANCSMEAGDYEEALMYVDRAISKSHDEVDWTPEAFFLLRAQIFMRSDQWEKASQELSDNVSPIKGFQAWLEYAKPLFWSGDHEKALSAFRKTLELVADAEAGSSWTADIFQGYLEADRGRKELSHAWVMIGRCSLARGEPE